MAGKCQVSLQGGCVHRGSEGVDTGGSLKAIGRGISSIPSSPRPLSQASPASISSALPASIKAERPRQELTWENRHHDGEHGVIPGYLDPTPVLIAVLHCQVLHGHHKHVVNGVISQGDPVPQHLVPGGRGLNEDGAGKPAAAPAPVLIGIRQLRLVLAGYFHGAPREAAHLLGTLQSPASCRDRGHTSLRASTSPRTSLPPVPSPLPVPLPCKPLRAAPRKTLCSQWGCSPGLWLQGGGRLCGARCRGGREGTGETAWSQPPDETPVPGNPLLLLPVGSSEKSCPSSPGQDRPPPGFPRLRFKKKEEILNISLGLQPPALLHLCPLPKTNPLGCYCSPQSAQVSVKGHLCWQAQGSKPTLPALPPLPAALMADGGSRDLQAPCSLPWGVFRGLWVGKCFQPLRGIEIVNQFLAEGKVGKKYIHKAFPSLLDEDVDFGRLAQP